MTGSLPRDHWQRELAHLDPVEDAQRIAQIVGTHEFPWDTVQALSFALFRTYAVPSIGRLLHDTGEFTERTQKRYDDTALLLEVILEHSLATATGRVAVRRINQMHRAYDISNDDMRYVLATFVVMPVRWMARFGYRSFTSIEIRGLTEYYRELGSHMNIRDLPADYLGFAALLDDYETAHFAYDDKSRRVADATLDLMTTFFPNNLAPRALVKRFAFSLMDERLRNAFGYPAPTVWEQRVYLAAMRARQRFLARRPARRDPKWTRDFSYVKSTETDPDKLGTFPTPGETFAS